MGKGWSDKYKKSIDCNNPKGFSQRAHCQGKKKMNEEGLRDWFGKSKSKDGKSGWVNVVTGGTCASDEPGEGTPKCVSSAKRASMTKAERLSAQRRKKKADPGQQQKTGAAKPTYVKTDSPRKMKKEEVEVTEAKDKPGKGSGTKDACYHKVKSRYSVWPSAYASGALVKCRKVGAKNWGNKTKKEEIELTDAYGETFAVVHDLIKPEPIQVVTSAVDYDTYELEEATRVNAETGNLIHVMLTWKGRTYGMKMFFPQVKMPKRSEVQAELEKVYPGCRVTYFRIVEREPGETFLYVSEGAAWTKKSGKNQSGGLNEKGRKSYERENPGSDLKRPSKKVGNPRRKSFCARMKGMKKKLTSSKTANDPDSRINKSLRAWNC